MIERTTELRHLEASHVHEISLILDENDGWKHIMSSIPKVYDAVSFSNDSIVDWETLMDKVGYKYTNDQIRKIATPRPGDSRLPAEIFLDEWATSGKKENRPTVGVFLQLLVKAELFRAADHVAVKWLSEPSPSRPTRGPAARVNTDLPSGFLNEVESYVNDSTFQPATEDLQENAVMMINGKQDNNQDYYTKFRRDDKNWSMINSSINPPTPTPRKNRKSERLQSQDLSPSNRSNRNKYSGGTTPSMKFFNINGEHEKTTIQTNTKSTLNGTTESTEINFTENVPLLSVFASQQEQPKISNIDDIAPSNSIPISTSIDFSAPIPSLSALQQQESTTKSDAITTDTDNLPDISALNLNGQHDNVEHIDTQTLETQQNGVCSNDDFNDYDTNDADVDIDDDNDENSLSKLGSSNNDSSLTNITGTSGENSFEMSSSSTSNENIPLNVLQH